MKKLFVKIIFLALVILVPSLVMAQVGVKVRVNIPLPPPIIFPAPPALVVIPETNVYAVPDVTDDVFFQGGWWWRPWEGRWYRSKYYDRGWAYYKGVPVFHRNFPPGWRKAYQDGYWNGHAWDRHPIPHNDVAKNWRGWERNKHWEKQNHWGVKGIKPVPPGQQKKFNQRNDGPQAGQQKKFNQRNDGPQRGDGPGPQGGPGRGNRDRDRGPGDRGQEDRR